MVQQGDCTTNSTTAAVSRVAKRTPGMCPGVVSQRVCATGPSVRPRWVFPGDLRVADRHRFLKRKIEVSLRTKSESKAARSAAALSDRLERYWDSLRMEMIYSKELGLTVLPEARPAASDSFCLTDALALYHRLKGTGKTNLFFESSERSIRYLIECLGHDSLTSLEVSDAGRFRDYLFERGVSSSSVKRVFSSVRAVINLAIREHGLSMTNVFSGTFIPDDEVKKKRLPIPAPDLVKTRTALTF